ncbi:NUDIX hydrolase [Alkalicaulis satelles]|uniref:NUDIX hydrolase n=1 Tax=Alkalicaulis satelles TaxID=2609175 RepID=A0A5M6ZRR3_9PROT|nr:NUDIX hydrolase [Alkalicaulis satelles]KAA5804971.1 NUDIX hydrolase [Alkalicaulis satelles]
MSVKARPVVSTGAIIWRGGEVLLIRRGKPPFQGEWSIPGGKVEFGERLEEALIREVREETGVEIALTGLIGVYESLGADWHYVMVDYAARWISGAPRAGDDALDARFVPYEDALELIAWDTTRTALRDALAQRDRRPGPA